MRLYRVNLRGFRSEPVGTAMVVAEDPTSAYDVVRKWLDDNDYGCRKDRELQSIELLADDYEYADAPHQLFLPDA